MTVVCVSTFNGERRKIEKGKYTQNAHVWNLTDRPPAGRLSPYNHNPPIRQQRNWGSLCLILLLFLSLLFSFLFCFLGVGVGGLSSKSLLAFVWICRQSRKKIFSFKIHHQIFFFFFLSYLLKISIVFSNIDTFTPDSIEQILHT